MKPLTRLVKRDSVASQLLLRVLVCYFGVALGLVALDVLVQYRSVKEEVHEELRLIHASFAPGLSQALWDINTEQVQSFFEGMTSLPSVVGGEIRDESGAVICIGGIVQDEGGIAINAKDKSIDDGWGSLFSHRQEIIFVEGEDQHKVGEAIIYSSSVIVFQRLTLGIGLTLIQVCVSAALLCLIFVWFFRRLLGRPLGILMEAVEDLDPDDIENFQVDVAVPQRNELKVLEESFNDMAQNLATDRAELLAFRAELESQVEERTAELRQMIDASEERAYSESSLAALTANIQGNLSTQEIAERGLEGIIAFFDAPVGTLFVVDDEGRLCRQAAHALPVEEAQTETFDIGNGSVGQVAQSRVLSVVDVADQSWSVNFGLGAVTPCQIVTCPLIAGDLLIGVVELYLLLEMTEAQSQWLSKAAEVCAAALRFSESSLENEAVFPLNF